MKHVVPAMMAFVTGLALLWAGAAGAGMTAEQKCEFKRAKEKGKYEKCVGNWLAKCYGKGECDQEKLSKCRVKYQEKWPKLQKLTGTTCDAPRFVDSGVSVTDNLTGLIWEKKTDDGSDRDVDNVYTWTAADGDDTDEDGTAFAFLAVLNVSLQLDGAFGWRMPTFAELQTILLPELYPCSTSPCVDPIFAPTQSGFYWSSTTGADFPGNAWYVFFDFATVGLGSKYGNGYVRAVRAGL